MKKIGIYGGTFNPIHNGHLNMAKQVGITLGLDKILVIPANIPPHKIGIPIIEDIHRYEMCRIACERDSIFEACDIELKRKGRSYTVDTLMEISKKYIGSDLFLIMGTDSFITIKNWVGFNEIIKLATLCVAPRTTGELSKLSEAQQILKSKGARTMICNISIVPLSSTEIRKRITKDIDFERMLPKGVVDYIRKNQLYI